MIWTSFWYQQFATTVYIVPIIDINTSGDLLISGNKLLISENDFLISTIQAICWYQHFYVNNSVVNINNSNVFTSIVDINICWYQQIAWIVDIKNLFSDIGSLFSDINKSPELLTSVIGTISMVVCIYISPSINPSICPAKCALKISIHSLTSIV